MELIKVFVDKPTLTKVDKLLEIHGLTRGELIRKSLETFVSAHVDFQEENKKEEDKEDK